MAERWTVSKDWIRRDPDGLLISQTQDGNWMIMGNDTRKPVTLCPCCHKPMIKPSAAMAVADALYPAP